MERTHAWLLVVVAASLGAGIAAFALATPDQSTRIERDRLGFRMLDGRVIASRLERTGEQHRRRHRRATLERGAATVARRWLVALPTGGQRPRTEAALPMPVGEDADARRRVRAFSTWLDGVPASSVRIVVGQTVPLARDDAWAVDAVVHVDLAQATEDVRRLRHPIVVEVAAPARLGGRWRVLDVHVDAPSTWLRAYADPLVLRGRAVHVVGPAAAADDVAQVLELTDGRLPWLRRRLAPLPGHDRATAWLVADATRAGLQLGAPARTGAAHDPIAWADPRGELVVALDAWRAAAPARRERAVRHAAFHVAVLGGAERSPVVLVEAAAHALAGAEAPPLAPEVRAALDEAVGRPLAELLVAAPSAKLEGAAEHHRARALGAWIAAVHGPAAAVELLAQVQRGIAPEQAVRRVLRAAPRGVDRRVRAWAAADPSTGADGREAPPGGDQLVDEEQQT